MLALDRLLDCGDDEVGVAEPSKRHPDDAILEVLADLRGDLERQPCLSGASGPGQGEQPRSVSQERNGCRELLLAAQKGSLLRRKVRRVERTKRRELAVADLVE